VRCIEVLVREDRPLSLAIAERSGVAHQSPQVICFEGGKAVGHASHYDITVAGLKKMVAAP
jgi:bacillithiol system protein YtxJ